MPPTGLLSGLLSNTARIKNMTIVVMKIMIPPTPVNAINFNFSIFVTNIKGSYKTAINNTKKYVLR